MGHQLRMVHDNDDADLWYPVKYAEPANIDIEAVQSEYSTHRMLRRNMAIAVAVIGGLDIIAIAVVLLLVK